MSEGLMCIGGSVEQRTSGGAQAVSVAWKRLTQGGITGARWRRRGWQAAVAAKGGHGRALAVLVGEAVAGSGRCSSLSGGQRRWGPGEGGRCGEGLPETLVEIKGRCRCGLPRRKRAQGGCRAGTMALWRSETAGTRLARRREEMGGGVTIVGKEVARAVVGEGARER